MEPDILQSIRKSLADIPLSLDEQAHLDKWSIEHPDELEEYKKLWENYGQLRLTMQSDPEEAWEKASTSKSGLRPRISSWQIAASVAFFLLAAIFSASRMTTIYTYDEYSKNEIFVARHFKSMAE